jgi:hypothetical protein
MNLNLVRRGAIGAFVALTVALPAGASAATTGKVRIVNGTPGAGTISLWVDGKRKVTAASGAASTAIYVKAGLHRFAVTRKGSKRAFAAFASRVRVSAGKSYTIGSAGTSSKRGKARLFWFTNSKTVVPGAARVRAVHLLAGGPAVDVGPPGLPVIKNVRYGHSSSYISLPGYNTEYGYGDGGYGYTTDYGYGLTLPLVVTKHGTSTVLKSYLLKVNGSHVYSAYAVKSGSGIKVILVKDA